MCPSRKQPAKRRAKGTSRGTSRGAASARGGTPGKARATPPRRARSPEQAAEKPARPRSGPAVPRHWETLSAQGDRQLRALAARAKEAVLAARSDQEAVVRALIAYHAAWIETAFDDTAVRECVSAWIAELSMFVGMDPDSTLERVVMRAVDLSPAPQSQLAEAIAAILGWDRELSAHRLTVLLDAVCTQLRTSSEEFAVPGFSSFVRRDYPSQPARIAQGVLNPRDAPRWQTVSFRAGRALKDRLNRESPLGITGDHVAASSCAEAWRMTAGLERADAAAFLNALSQALAQVIARAGSVRCDGLGTLIGRRLAGRSAQNPKTLEPISIAARETVSFMPEDHWHRVRTTTTEAGPSA